MKTRIAWSLMLGTIGAVVVGWLTTTSEMVSCKGIPVGIAADCAAAIVGFPLRYHIADGNWGAFIGIVAVNILLWSLAVYIIATLLKVGKKENNI